MKGTNGYYKLRAYSSEVHTFELSKSQNDIIYTVGIPKKLETVSAIYKSVPDSIAAINGPLFNFDASSEGLFLWSKELKTLIYTKENKLMLVDAKKLTKEQIEAYQAYSKWCCGIGYTLIQDRKINIETIAYKDKNSKTQYVADPYNPNPRTMIGQLKDGSIFLVAVKGRTLLSKGMTAHQQAQFMKDMGCVTAVNLDGGGSSDMIVNGKARIGSKRAVGGCFVVVKKNSDMQFIDKIIPGALTAYKQFNILPSLTLAQAILESNWGKSKLSTECFNLFGIKWSKDCGHEGKSYPTTEYEKGIRILVNAIFRKYKSYDESIVDHSELLTKSRYKPVIAAKEYKLACMQVQACGYATDPNYSKSLIALIEKYKLNLYDKEVTK